MSSTLSGGYGGESLEQNWATSDVSGAEEDDVNEVSEEEEEEEAAVRGARAAQSPSVEAASATATGKRKPAVAHIPRGEASKKKRQRRGKRGSSLVEDAPLINGSAAEVRDHVWRLYTNAMGDRLSALEQEDSMPSVDRFHRSASEMSSNAAEVVKASLEDWQTKLKKAVAFGGKKSPKVLIVSGNSNRACSIIQQLTGLGLKVPIAKLFSRHMKLKQQKEMLASRGFACGVGTPNRVLKLLDLEYLKLKRTELVILDLSRDLKGYHMLTQKDTAKDTASLMQRFLFSERGVGCHFAVLV